MPSSRSPDDARDGPPGPSQAGTHASPEQSFEEELYDSGSEDGSPPPKRQRHRREGSARRKQAHVGYEQRRRRMINQGFERLKALLPDDREEGDSRARLLERAADRIEELERLQNGQSSIPTSTANTNTARDQHTYQPHPHVQNQNQNQNHPHAQQQPPQIQNTDGPTPRRHSTGTATVFRTSLSAMTAMTPLHRAPAPPSGPLGGSLAEAVAFLTQGGGHNTNHANHSATHPNTNVNADMPRRKSDTAARPPSGGNAYADTNTGSGERRHSQSKSSLASLLN